MTAQAVAIGSNQVHGDQTAATAEIISWLFMLWLASMITAFFLGMGFWMLCGSRLCQWRKKRGELQQSEHWRVISRDRWTTSGTHPISPRRDSSASRPSPLSSRSTESSRSVQGGIRNPGTEGTHLSSSHGRALAASSSGRSPRRRSVSPGSEGWWKDSPGGRRSRGIGARRGPSNSVIDSMVEAVTASPRPEGRWKKSHLWQANPAGSRQPELASRRGCSPRPLQPQRSPRERGSRRLWTAVTWSSSPMVWRQTSCWHSQPCWERAHSRAPTSMWGRPS